MFDKIVLLINQCIVAAILQALQVDKWTSIVIAHFALVSLGAAWMGRAEFQGTGSILRFDLVARAEYASGRYLLTRIEVEDIPEPTVPAQDLSSDALAQEMDRIRELTQMRQRLPEIKNDFKKIESKRMTWRGRFVLVLRGFTMQGLSNDVKALKYMVDKYGQPANQAQAESTTVSAIPADA